MSDLKPCPCCGHCAELREEQHDYGIVWTIECFWCGLMIEGSKKEAVINTWNSRRTDGMVAWLDAEIEKCKWSSWEETARIRSVALRQCKQQLLKLLDGMGVEE